MKIILDNTLKQKNISRYKLSGATGIAASTLSHLCNNQTSSITFENLDKICGYLNCTPNDIMQPDCLNKKDGTK